MIGKDTATSVNYEGDDTASSFPIPFPVYESEFVEVRVVFDEGEETEEETKLVYLTDFTLQKIGVYGLQASLTLVDSGQDWITDGALGDGYKLYIEVTREAYQPANLRTVDGLQSLIAVEKSLDRMALNVRRSNDYLDDEMDALDEKLEAIVLLIETITGLPVTSVSAGENGTLPMDQSEARQHLIKVQGSSGPVTLNEIPFLGAVADGRIVMVMGLSDTNTVRINHNDAPGGCVMQGDMILRRFDFIYFLRDEGTDRFVEVSRSKQ